MHTFVGCHLEMRDLVFLTLSLPIWCSGKLRWAEECKQYPTKLTIHTNKTQHR